LALVHKEWQPELSLAEAAWEDERNAVNEHLSGLQCYQLQLCAASLSSEEESSCSVAQQLSLLFENLALHWSELWRAVLDLQEKRKLLKEQILTRLQQELKHVLLELDMMWFVYLQNASADCFLLVSL
jgi:hypothetical protein